MLAFRDPSTCYQTFSMLLDRYQPIELEITECNSTRILIHVNAHHAMHDKET